MVYFHSGESESIRFEEEMHLLKQTYTDELEQLKNNQDRLTQENKSAHHKEMLGLKQQHQKHLIELTSDNHNAMKSYDQDSEQQRETLLDIEERLQDDRHRYVVSCHGDHDCGGGSL